MGEQLPPGVLHVYRRRIWIRLLRLDGLGRAGDLRERLQSDAAKPVRGLLLVHVLPGPSYAAPDAGTDVPSDASGGLRLSILPATSPSKA